MIKNAIQKRKVPISEKRNAIWSLLLASGYLKVIHYEVMLEPLHPEDDGIIIEFKVFQPKKEKNLQETVATALKQIEQQKYETALLAKGIPKEKIRKYGFAFQGKTVLIGDESCNRKKEK